MTYRPLDDFLRQVKVPMAGPLVDLIRDRYRPLFAIGDYEGAAPHANYDVLPDGSGFVMVRQGRASELSVIQNWPEIVRRQDLAAGR